MSKKYDTLTEEEVIEKEHELMTELKRIHQAPAHKVYKAFQAQYFLNKLAKEQQKRLSSDILPESDVFRACHLAVTGMKELKDIINEKTENIIKPITENKYEDIVIPLGNFIIGYKVISNYCTDYLEPNIINTSKIEYNEMKEKIKKLTEDVNWQGTSGEQALFRKHGINPLPLTPQGIRPEVIYNVNRKGITDMEEWELRDIIKEYESKSGKNAFWRGAKTKPFEHFISQ